MDKETGIRIAGWTAAFAVASLAILTVISSLVHDASVFAANDLPQRERLEKQFETAWKENKPDEASKEKLASLCCATGRYDQARKFLAEVHAMHVAQSVDKYSPTYSNDFTKMAQAEIGDGKFERALSLYQEQLDYDLRFLSKTDPRIARDYSNIATAQYILGQTEPDRTKRESHWTLASAFLQKAKDLSPDSASPADALKLNEKQLVLAQAINDRASIRKYQQEVLQDQSRLGIGVPIGGF